MSVVNTNHLFWLDLEMTGVDAQNDHILEIASLVTDEQLNIIAEGPSLAIHQPPDHLNVMNDYVRNLHTDSGLLNRVAESTVSVGFAEKQTIAFFQRYCVAGVNVLCGNSVWVDRSFLKRYMPALDACFHYRIIDVSSFKEIIKRWYPNLPPFKKEKNHIALQDIYESINELQYYRTMVFKPYIN